MSTVRRRIAPLRVIAALALGAAPFFGLAQPSRAAVSVVAAGGHSTASYRQEALSLSAEISRWLGQPLGFPIIITVNKTEVYAPALMYATALDAQGGMVGTPAQCSIGVNPKGDALYGLDWQVTLAHEVWHCFQAARLGLPRFSRFATSPQTKWIIEGQAMWVGELVAGPDPMEALGWWKRYLSFPQTPLFARTYDAIGFYAHVAERCGGPSYVWSTLQGMLDKIPDNRAAYEVATAGCGASFLDTWASGFFREQDRGSAWNTKGPAMPAGDTRQAALQGHTVVLANGQAVLVSADLYTNDIYEFTSHADIVQTELRGHARLSDAGNFDYILAGETSFCTRVGGCKCPAGSTYQGPTLTPLTTPADLAVTGGTEANGTRLRLAGISLDDFCTQKPAPLPGSGGALPNPCKVVTLNDVEQIVGLDPDYLDRTFGPFDDRNALGCEHVVVGAGVTGTVLIVVEGRAGKKLSGPGKAMAGLGDEARLQAASDYATLVVAKGHLVILIQVTMGARSTRIALALARKALPRL
jgi:hypothetical protein